MELAGAGDMDGKPESEWERANQPTLRQTLAGRHRWKAVQLRLHPVGSAKSMTAPSQTVIFLHIPKTGGTTFHRILERHFARNQTLTFDGRHHRDEIERFAKLPEPQRARHRLIKGHLYFGFHRLVPGNSTYLTFLREPVARALSFYSYARSNSDHYLYRSLTEERLELRTLLERGTTAELFNLQTRMIAGDQGNLDRPLDRSALERAKQNLQTNFCLVGLTEEFDASLILLSRTFDWSLPFYVKKNVSRKKSRPENIDAQTHALLRQANALDLELYEFAQKLFDAQLRNAGDSFEYELRRFQRLNFLGARAYQHYDNLIQSVKQVLGRRESSRSLAGLKQTRDDSSI